MLRSRGIAGIVKLAQRAPALSPRLASGQRVHAAAGSPASRQTSAQPSVQRARSFSSKSALHAQQKAVFPVNEEKCSVQRSKDGQQVAVKWEDGHSSTYDNIFLVDHCRCPSCFHPQTKQRLKTLGQIPADLALDSASIVDGSLHLKWSSPSEHTTELPLSFLRQASYDPPLGDRAGVLRSVEPKFWGATIASDPPTVAYASVMPETAGVNAERGVLEWLNKVDEYGFCFVTGVPVTPEATEELIRRMSFIRETHYGGFWDFTADMSKGDLAYSNQALPAHTDTAYFTDPAGLQIFHCLKDGQGGETLLVDSFYAAKELRTKDPKAYETLSSLAVPFHASGNEGTLLRPPISQPVLRHDHLGKLMQARWNNEDRCVLGEGWAPSEIREWYRAARAFEDIVTSASTEYWSKLTPGTVVVIDNWRVMHGRAAFTGERRMCGAYVGADDWNSRRRALIRQFSPLSEGAWSVGW